MNEYQKKKLQAQVEQNFADKPAVKAAYEERKEAQAKKRRMQQTISNLSNGGILLPKPKELLGGLEEIADMVRRPGRPRKK